MVRWAGFTAMLPRLVDAKAVSALATTNRTATVRGGVPAARRCESGTVRACVAKSAERGFRASVFQGSGGRACGGAGGCDGVGGLAVGFSFGFGHDRLPDQI